MTWFKVDDRLAFHHKVIAAGNSAMGLWVRAGSWAASQETDGTVPENIARMLGSRIDAKRLVEAGLWLPVEGGFLFHDWTVHNPTRAQNEERREKREKKRATDAERLRRWRENHRREGGEET